jgi:hypothetical protein
MATTAFLASGTLLKMGDENSPRIYTTIYEVTDIGDFGAENDLIEVTHMQSTSKEYIYGLADGVEFNVTVNYLPTNDTHVDLLAAQASRISKHFRMIMPPSAGNWKFDFDALVKGFRLSLSPNEAGQMSFNFKVTGSIVGGSATGA